MSDKKRFDFDGFTYGNDGETVLIVRVKKDPDLSDWSSKFELDLTEADRLNLISFLARLPEKDK